MTRSVEEKRSWLEKVPLFGGCGTDVLDRLAAATAEFEFAAGQAIVQQGRVGNGLYIIVEGEVRIVQGTTELARLGQGDFFGELSVLDQQPRNASVYAVEPTTCLALAAWDVMPMLESDARLTLNLLRELVRRLRSTDEQLRH